MVLLVLGSLNNVIGYQTIRSSPQQIIDERITQRELLFQAIADIVNNKEIQRIILKSQMSRGIFPPSEIPVLTKNQIRQMYFICIILSKVIDKSKIQTMIGKYLFNNQEIQKDIYAVIEKDTIINSEIAQLKDSDCDCDKEITANWHFPILCTILEGLFWSLWVILEKFFPGGANNEGIGGMTLFGVFFIAIMLQCQWAFDLWPDPY